MQCVLVRREGNVFAGMTVSLLRVSSPDRPRVELSVVVLGGSRQHNSRRQAVLCAVEPMRFLRLPAPRLVLLAALAAVALGAPAAPAAAAAAADGITRGTIYQDGPDNRYLLGGEWLFRRDDAGVGLRQSFQRQPARDGWAPLTVPNAWNVGD